MSALRVIILTIPLLLLSANSTAEHTNCGRFQKYAEIISQGDIKSVELGLASINSNGGVSLEELSEMYCPINYIDLDRLDLNGERALLKYSRFVALLAMRGGINLHWKVDKNASNYLSRNYDDYTPTAVDVLIWQRSIMGDNAISEFRKIDKDNILDITSSLLSSCGLEEKTYYSDFIASLSKDESSTIIDAYGEIPRFNINSYCVQ